MTTYDYRERQCTLLDLHDTVETLNGVLGRSALSLRRNLLLDPGSVNLPQLAQCPALVGGVMEWVSLGDGVEVPHFDQAKKT